jgi:hypothetical protein
MTPEQAKELKHTVLWEGFCQEIDRFIEFEMTKLRVCTTDELREIQARIRVYENVKAIPDVVIDREALDRGASDL